MSMTFSGMILTSATNLTLEDDLGLDSQALDGAFVVATLNRVSWQGAHSTTLVSTAMLSILHSLFPR